ncbi:guanylate kinase [bacterium]|nr:guanylate kinase [bacterium]
MCNHTTLLELNNPKPLVIVLSGPSGVGKDAVLKVMQKRGMAFHFVVTSTDRKPRKEEVNGVDYNFISTEQFKRMIDNNEFVEHALVYGDLKGVPKSQIVDALASGKDVVLRLDVQGAARLRELFPDSIQIFLIPENEEKWRQRFISRKSETEEMLQKRMQIAHQELERVGEFNYIVINCTDCLDTTVNQIAAIIEAEHLKVRTGS